MRLHQAPSREATFRVVRQDSPVCPTHEEIHANPRSRSARLRSAERTDRTLLESILVLIGEHVMIRTLNFAFIAITGFVCLGLYRIAEEARVAQADLRETQYGDRAASRMRSPCSAPNGRA